MMLNKLIAINDVKKKFEKLENLTIVQCHGVFDILHYGHINYFIFAKKKGDILIVTITPDKFVVKGPNRPAFSTNLRLEALQALECVDYVSVNKWATASQTIRSIKPNIYCKGRDYKKKENDITKKIYEEEEVIKSIKGKIKFTNTQSFSSSNLLNNFLKIHSDQQRKYLNNISKKFSFTDIKKIFSDFFSIRVLVIGEAIIDKYVFCEALGKSGKEPILALREIKTEQYYGGSLAISNHLSDFCNSIKLLTMIGENKEYKQDIIKNKAKNISIDFFYKSNSPTIVKKRFVDSINKNKILGVYEINDELIDLKQQKSITLSLEKLKKSIDHIIVSDYGHGFISEQVAKKIINVCKSVSLSAQLNAANLGMHTINKYKKIETLVINEMELRQEMKDRNSLIKNLMKKLTQKIKIKNLIVTRGKNGSILYDKNNNEFIECPAFASSIVDKIGAGDAMLSIISIALNKGIDKHLSLLLGSLAAAQSVESMGNSIFVDKNKMLKVIESLIK